jgi:hypothetical protein
MRLAAKILSIILHPLLMPTVGMLLLFNSGTYLQFIPYDYKRVMLLIVMIITAAVPILLMPLFRLKRLITSVGVSKRSERVVPLFFATILYIINLWYMYKMKAPVTVMLFMLGAALTVFFAWVISFFWKISVHMMAAGGVIGLIFVMIFRLYAQVNLFLMVSIIMAGIIGSVRIYLDRNNSAQVYIGFISGFILIVTPFLILV